MDNSSLSHTKWDCTYHVVFILDMPEAVFSGFLVGLLAMMFHSGLHLILESGINKQIGLMVGISVCTWMMAESQNFFPGIPPPCLAPLTSNGIAAGGLVAVFLSVAFHWMRRPRVAFGLKPTVNELPGLIDRLNEGAESLELAPREPSVLQMACEEVFLNIPMCHSGYNGRASEWKPHSLALPLGGNKYPGNERRKCITGGVTPKELWDNGCHKDCRSTQNSAGKLPMSAEMKGLRPAWV